MRSILETGQGDAMIVALSRTIQYLAIDRLHIIGDIYDRGPRADLILDALIGYHQVDVQWGNHDIVWMGAAALCEACIAQVVVTSVMYGNLDTLEVGYGISLRPLATMAMEVYADDPCDAFRPHENGEALQEDEMQIARMHKAAAVLEFKLEGQLIARHRSTAWRTGGCCTASIPRPERFASGSGRFRCAPAASRPWIGTTPTP